MLRRELSRLQWPSLVGPGRGAVRGAVGGGVRDCGGGKKNQSAMPKGNYSYGGARALVYQRLPRLTDTQFDGGPLNKTKTL